MQPPEATDTSDQTGLAGENSAHASGAALRAGSVAPSAEGTPLTDCPWRIASSANLQWRTWDHETLIYHPPSGDTHCLNPVAAAALQAIIHQPATLAQLVTMLSHELELTDSESLTQQLGAFLMQFHELGVIEPCDARQ